MRVACSYTGSRGVYANLIPDVSSSRTLHRLVSGSVTPPFTPRLEHHLTVIASEVGVSTSRLAFPKCPIVVKPGRFEVWETEHQSWVVVLNVDDSRLSHLHNLFIQKGARHRHLAYRPHLTVSHPVNTGEKSRLEQWVGCANALLAQNRVEITLNRLRIRDL